MGVIFCIFFVFFVICLFLIAPHAPFCCGRRQKARSAFAFIAVCGSARLMRCSTPVRRVAALRLNCQHRYAAHELGMTSSIRALS
ncbi:MAG: hypothetical protein LBC48_09500, partial [Dysgonamonadaceae bacterium]|nr:hypothetical protein [Dysgonamonadaceae bacterium]